MKKILSTMDEGTAFIIGMILLISWLVLVFVPNYIFWKNVIRRGKKDKYISIHHPEYSSILTDGAIAYGKEKGFVMHAHVLEVPEEKTSRPTVTGVQRFYKMKEVHHMALTLMVGVIGIVLYGTLKNCLEFLSANCCEM